MQVPAPQAHHAMKNTLVDHRPWFVDFAVARVAHLTTKKSIRLHRPVGGQLKVLFNEQGNLPDVESIPLVSASLKSRRYTRSGHGT
jgi:hypothetical protein